VQKHHIGILHFDEIDNSIFCEFVSKVNHSGLNIEIEQFPKPGPFATLEWFIPTAIIAFIGKAYFEEFLKEMGKDHYNALKISLAKLTKNSVSQPHAEPILISSPGKVCKDNPYSLAYSILAEGNNGYRFKLLIPKYSSDINYQNIVTQFMEFISDYHSLGDKSSAAREVQKSQIPGGTVLVHYNPKTEAIEWLDHVPPDVRARMNSQE